MSKRTAEEVLRSLVADIEAMQALNRPGELIYEMGYSNDKSNDHMPKDFFGPFKSYVDHDEHEPGMVDGGDGISIEWPNLRILLDEAKEILK